MYLNTHTGLSFKYGTLSPELLFQEARRCGVHKLALTEINNTASYMEMIRICDKNRPGENGLTKFGETPWALDLAVGVEFRNPYTAFDSPPTRNASDGRGAQADKSTYAKASTYAETATVDKTADKSTYAKATVDADGPMAWGDTLYIAIAKNNAGFETINRFLSYHNREDKPFPARAPELENTFIIYPLDKILPELLRENEFVGVYPYQVIQFSLYPPVREFIHKYVILQPVTFMPPERKGKKQVYRDHNMHRLLRCIANNTILSKLPEQQQARKDEFMRPEIKLEEHFERFPELIWNTRHLLDQCSFECKQHEDKNKKFFTGNLEDDLKFLRDETEKGYKRLYGDDRKIWNDRIEKELTIIRNKGFTSYYLITYDLVNFAKSKSYDFVGRGSGANSTVAYCLGITNVDPIELDLYFERFLNEERTTPPDFDIDFSWDNRDEIYNYLFEKYGKDHICLLGTHVTFQWRSILRELGKVFGLPKEEIDDLVDDPKQISQRDQIAHMAFEYANLIVNRELPSHGSIHAGGVLITEKPIYAYTATNLPPKGYPVSHFEMHSAEDFGIYKFDILSQRGLGHIKETVKHAKRNKGVDVDVYRFREFKKDEKIKELLRNSKAMGCFYVESPAMRMLLSKLRCEDYLTLVAASSIIRPGVASSGMMRAYIERFHAVKNGGTYEAIHPKMDELMRETFGVMVYQEDVIKVAHHFAGLTLTEADVLRRGMSGKYRSREEFQRVKDRFFDNCKKIGYEQKVTDRVWYEIESFSGYSFAKGHSASYAVESYQSLYLKAHYPLEFMVGVINNFGGFYRTEFYFHEARMNGASIEAPCINRSEYLTTIYGDQIYIGFIHLKSLEKKIAERISIERLENGPYKSLDNFLRRTPGIGLEQLRILIRTGAFRFIGKTKQKLLWEAMLFFSSVKSRPDSTVDLFDTEPKEFPLPALQRNELEDAFDELELIGFPLCDPFKLLLTSDYGNVVARDLVHKINKQVRIVGYVVTTKDTRTLKGEPMHFGTFYDAKGEAFDTVHFPNIARDFPFRGRGFYQIIGKVTEDFGVYAIEVARMEKLSMVHKRPEKVLQEQPQVVTQKN